MKVPLIDLSRQTSLVRDEVMGRLARLLHTNSFILGPAVAEFEEEYSRFLGATATIGVSSGTDALLLSLLAIGAGPDDEVVVPAFGFPATAEAVLLAGATPVFVDVDDSTLTLDLSDLAASITRRTVAVIPVHLYGQPAHMHEILKIADEKGIAVIEDASQAHGSKYGDRFVGTLGTLGCFSFYPTKTLGAWGDAGGICTADPILADRVRRLRHHGQLRKHDHDSLGMNARLDAAQAVVLSAKLQRLPSWLEERAAIASRYDSAIPNTVRIPSRLADRDAAWHLYVIRTNSRDLLQSHLRKEGIETGLHYPYALHQLTPFAKYADRKLPNAELAAKQVLSLPFYPGLSNQSQDQVIAALSSWHGPNGRGLTA